MQRLLSLLPVLATRFFHSRRDLLLENLALRQQLAVLKVRQPRFAASDKLFWVMLCRLWPGWKQALILVLSPAKIVICCQINQMNCVLRVASLHARTGSCSVC
jgi:hypothetical protein